MLKREEELIQGDSMDRQNTGYDEGMRDARESTEQASHADVHAPSHGVEEPPQIVLDPNRKLGRGPIIGVLLVAVVLAVAILIGIFARAHAEANLKTETKQDAIEAVSVTTPSAGSKALEIVLPADTQAYIDTPIYARTSGYLRKWFADIGTHVHQGQVLAEIETPELDQQVQQAQSDLATAQANQNLAETTEARWKKLVAKNAVSKQEADQATSDFSAKTSAFASAQANVRRLQQMQGFEKVYAPFDGVITARNIDVGSLIQEGDSGQLKAELFHMASTDKLRLFVPVPEVYAGYIHNGDHVAVTTDGAPGEKITGTIARNSDSIDISSRTLNVEVDVNNAEHKLRPGQYAFVHLPIPPTSASMTLPSNTLLFRAEGLQVGVVRNGRVVLTPVTVGHDYGAHVEIISGLTPQDQVIMNPSDSLAQGEPVRVEKGAAE